MKKYFISVLAITAISLTILVGIPESMAQRTAVVSTEEATGPELRFSEENLNLGQLAITDLETFSRDIEFKNEGNQPLILSQVRGCCGTRIIEWPREPIAPGEVGVIKIQFRLAPRAHNVRRTVTVLSNDKQGQKVFRILGEVVE